MPQLNDARVERPSQEKDVWPTAESSHGRKLYDHSTVKDSSRAQFGDVYHTQHYHGSYMPLPTTDKAVGRYDHFELMGLLEPAKNDTSAQGTESRTSSDEGA
jgi:hypothetical protein